MKPKDLQSRIIEQGYTMETMMALVGRKSFLLKLSDEFRSLCIDLQYLLATIFHLSPEVLVVDCEEIQWKVTDFYQRCWDAKERYKAENNDPYSLFWVGDIDILRDCEETDYTESAEYGDRLKKMNKIMEFLLACGANPAVVL